MVSMSTIFGDQIRYTDDGTDPVRTSLLYLGPIEISEDTTLKAIAQGTGILASDISGPVEFVVNLRYNKIGIYTDDGGAGANGITVLPNTSFNSYLVVTDPYNDNTW